MLIKRLNLFLLLASALSFAHVEQTRVESLVGEFKHPQHNATDYQLVTQVVSEVFAAEVNEADPYDSDFLSLTHSLFAGQSNRCACPDERLAGSLTSRYYHPQGRAPPVIA